MNTCLYCGKPVKNKFCNTYCVNGYYPKNKPLPEKIKEKLRETARNKWKTFKVNCHKCGKEIEIKEFNVYKPKKEKYYCSRSCANSRGPRSKETKEKISKKLKLNLNLNLKIKHKYYCQSCNIELKKSTIKLCENCSKFYRFKELFKKLNIYDTNIIMANNKALILLKKEYFINKKSLIMLKKEYNIQFSTISNFFKKNGIKLRNYEDSILNAYKCNRLNISNVRTKYKAGWHISWENKKFYLRSSYEFKYAKELDDNKIKYEVETKRIQYLNTSDNKFHTAVPDFYLPHSNMLVEIKSKYTLDLQIMKDRFKAYKDKGYKTKLIVDFVEIKI